MNLTDDEIEARLDSITINDLDESELFYRSLPPSDSRDLTYVASVAGYRGYDIYVRGDSIKDYGPHELFFYADDSTPIGFARLTKSPEKVSINMIAFIEEHRGYGNGRAFYEYILSERGSQIESDTQITYATARLYASLSTKWKLTFSENGRATIWPTSADRQEMMPRPHLN